MQTPLGLVAAISEPEEKLLRIKITQPTQTPTPGLSELKVLLNDLEAGYELVQSITINVRRLDRDNYIAKFPDANINASGESFHSAIINLKALIVDMFDLLRSVRKNQLGPEPRHRLTILNGLIRKNV